MLAAMGIGMGAQALQGIGAGLFPEIFGGQAEYKGEDPRKHKDKLTLSQAGASSMMTGRRQAAQQQQASDRIGVKTSGAPLGAQLATLANIGGRTSAQESAFAGDVKQIQQQSYANYINQVNNFEQQRYQADLYKSQSKANLFGSILGGLGSAGMMYAGGMFDTPGGGGGNPADPGGKQFLNFGKPRG